MNNDIDYKRLYELSIIEKEKILIDNQKKQEKINELTEELKSYKIPTELFPKYVALSVIITL